MKTINGRLGAGLGAAALTLLAACTVTGVGVEESVGVGYDGGYYEPYGYDYGGWGGAYFVGPSRCCDHRDDHRGDEHRGDDHRGDDHRGDEHRGDDHRGDDHRDHGRAPAYRPAPRERPTPSIPSRSRQR